MVFQLNGIDRTNRLGSTASPPRRARHGVRCAQGLLLELSRSVELAASELGPRAARAAELVAAAVKVNVFRGSGEIGPDPPTWEDPGEQCRGSDRPARHTQTGGLLDSWMVSFIPGFSYLDLQGVSCFGNHITPSAPVPSPQVRWLDPHGTHPLLAHLRNGGGPGALGIAIIYLGKNARS